MKRSKVNRRMVRATILGVLGAFAAATSHSSGDVGFGQHSFEEAIRQADFIGVINLLELEQETPSSRLARGEVVEVWKGNARDRVEINVKRVIGCDVSAAIPGETVVAILFYYPDENSYGFALFGHGRLPVHAREGLRFVRIDVPVPADLPGVLLGGSESGERVYRVEDVREYVGRVLRRRNS